MENNAQRDKGKECSLAKCVQLHFTQCHILGKPAAQGSQVNTRSWQIFPSLLRKKESKPHVYLLLLSQSVTRKQALWGRGPC